MAALDDWVSSQLDRSPVLFGTPPVVTPRTTEEKAFVSSVLTRALERGRLDPDEVRTVNEYLPELAGSIARMLGFERRALPAIAERGLVTADLLRSAMA